MNQKNVMTVLLSTIAGALAALVVCAFFLFHHKPAAQTAETPKPVIKQKPTPPERTEPSPPPTEEIKESEVEALTIETTYKKFYAEGSKCRRTYNEYFGNARGDRSLISPCNVELTFNRDGSAGKSIVVRRYDATAKEWGVDEKNVWKSKISDEEFKSLARLVINNEAFKNWNDSININVSNCRITVKYRNGTKSPMSNVDERATDYLPMVEAFKKLDGEISWENVR